MPPALAIKIWLSSFVVHGEIRERRPTADSLGVSAPFEEQVGEWFHKARLVARRPFFFLGRRYEDRRLLGQDSSPSYGFVSGVA